MHPRRSVLLGGTLTLLLAACSQSTPSGEANPYANGASYPWSYTAPESRLTPLTLTPGENTLHYEPVLAARNGWGPIEVNRSNGEQAAGDGRTLSINGKTYARGFGTHAGSELRFSLKGTGGATCTRFTADVGVDDEVGSRGSVVFEVYLDGARAYSSGTLTGASATKRVDLDITGKSELRMVVTDAGDNIHYDHADWADPKIYCVTAAPPVTLPPSGPSGTLDPSFDADGIVTTRFGEPDGVSSEASAVQQQPDGKVIAVGTMYAVGFDFKTVIARYNSGGSLDPSFGSAGTAVLNLVRSSATNASGTEGYRAIALQQDGKILLGGSTSGPTQFSSPLMVRLTSAGALDPTFGRGGIVETPDLLNGLTTKILVLGDGRLLVNSSRGVQRYHPNGTLDTTFADAGTLERRDQYSVHIADIALQSTGHILLLTGDGHLRRYTVDGQLDTSFGSNGQIGYEVWRAGYQEFRGISVLVFPGDRFLVGLSGRNVSGGTSKYDPPVVDDDSMLVQHEPDGALSSSFGTGGRVLHPEGFGLNGLQALPDGSLLAHTVRFNADGTFKQIYPRPGFNVTSSSVQADGRILVAGGKLRGDTCVYPCALDFAVARLFP